MHYPKRFEQFLIESVEECADRVLDLLNHVGERVEFGRAGRKPIRKGFLIPCLNRDELKFIKENLVCDSRKT